MFSHLIKSNCLKLTVFKTRILTKELFPIRNVSSQVMLYKGNFLTKVLRDSLFMYSHTTCIYFKTVKLMNQFILRDIARYEQTKIYHGFSKDFFFQITISLFQAPR